MPSKTPTSVTPAYLGVTLLLSWIYLLFYANSAGIEASAPVSLMSSGYTSSALFMVAALLVIAFAPFDKVAFLTSTPVKVVIPILLSASTALLIVGGSVHNLAFILAGGSATGIFSGFMAQQWVTAFRRIGIKLAVCSFPKMMAMAICVCMTVMYLPLGAIYAIIIALPIVSELMFHWVRSDLFPNVIIEAGPKDKPLNFLLVLLPVVVFYLATGFLDYSSNENIYAFIFYALCAFVPLVVAGCFVFIVARESFAHEVLVPVAFLIVVGVPIMTLHSYLPTAQFVSIGELGLEVVLFVVSITFADFFDLSMLKVYALARACGTVFNSIGWYAAQAVDGAGSSIASAQLSLMVVFFGVEVLVVCLVVAIVKARKSVGAEEPQSDGDIDGAELSIADASQKADASGGQGDEFERRCWEVAREYDLSKREIDVLELLARGCTAAHIQGKLYIAAGTVNYHTRNIYAKLGVHSKQEVVDLIAGRAENEGL